MIDTNLEITETESGAADLDRVEIDLAELVREACELFQTVAEDRQVELVAELPAHCALFGDRQRLQRAIANLIDNALKYTPRQRSRHRHVVRRRPSGAAHRRGHRRGHLARARRRASSSASTAADGSRSQPGNGLGLSLSLANARAHGGGISVESDSGPRQHLHSRSAASPRRLTSVGWTSRRRCSTPYSVASALALLLRWRCSRSRPRSERQEESDLREQLDRARGRESRRRPVDARRCSGTRSLPAASTRSCWRAPIPSCPGRAPDDRRRPAAARAGARGRALLHARRAALVLRAGPPALGPRPRSRDTARRRRLVCRARRDVALRGRSVRQRRSTSTSAGSISRTIAAGGGTPELDAVRLAWEGGPDDAFGASLALGVGARPDPLRSESPATPTKRTGCASSRRSRGTPATNHGSSSSRCSSDDRSGRAPVGASVRPSREDESDARLFWLGPRALGAFASESDWILGYWLDGGWVQGDERSSSIGDPDDDGRLPVEAVERRDVSGWAFDARPARDRGRAARAARHAHLRDRLGRRRRRRATITPIARAVSRPTRRASAASGASRTTAGCSTPSSRTSPSRRPEPASRSSSPARSTSSTTTTA